MSAGGKARGGSAKERSVFVGNIPYDVTEEMLKEIFSEAGSVMNFRLVTDRETGKPKGYGFCEYADGATALSAMRNLNGYEINGRNLRVDFADGGDKTNSNSHQSHGNNDRQSHGGGGGGGGSVSQQQGVSGEALINAIENAMKSFGPVKLYDMLVQLKEHARQKPEYTKTMLMANPALTHAIVQCFKTLNIPIPSPSETHQPALLSAPRAPALFSVPPQRSPLHGVGGGILGVAPPGSQPVAPAPSKPGSRWSARPGPLSAAAAAVATATAAAAAAAVTAGYPVRQQTPSPLLSMPPPSASVVQHQHQHQQMQQPIHQQHQQQHQQQQQQLPPAPLLQQPPTRNRDPRARARDPRLAKRASDPSPMDMSNPKRGRTNEAPPNTGGQFDAIAELAREMTPQKLSMLPPNEQQIVMAYMQQYNMSLANP